MNDADSYDAWRRVQRHAAPPPGFADRVMHGVRQTRVRPAPREVRPAWLPAVVWTAAAVVCAVRLYGFLDVLLSPTPEYSLVATEPLPEPQHVQPSPAGS